MRVLPLTIASFLHASSAIADGASPSISRKRSHHHVHRRIKQTTSESKEEVYDPFLGVAEVQERHLQQDDDIGSMSMQSSSPSATPSSMSSSTPSSMPSLVPSSKPSSTPSAGIEQALGTASPTTGPTEEETKPSPGDVEGYEYLGYGTCQDKDGQNYPMVNQIYTFSTEECGQFCDKFRVVDETIGTLRGYHWGGTGLNMHCTCMFDQGSDVEAIAEEFGGSRVHWGESVPAGSSSDGTGLGPISLLGTSNYDMYCYKVEEGGEPTEAAEAPTQCSCSPRTYNIRLNLSQDCTTNTLDSSPGINSTKCTQSNDSILSDIEIISIQFVEFEYNTSDNGSEMTTIHQDTSYAQTSLMNGDTVSFKSVSNDLNRTKPIEEQLEYVPGGVQMAIIGRAIDGPGMPVTQRLVWSFTNWCDILPVEDGDSIGWVTFENLRPASKEFCPIAPEAPLTASPSQKPTQSTSLETDTTTTLATESVETTSTAITTVGTEVTSTTSSTESSTTTKAPDGTQVASTTTASQEEISPTKRPKADKTKLSTKSSKAADTDTDTTTTTTSTTSTSSAGHDFDIPSKKSSKSAKKKKPKPSAAAAVGDYTTETSVMSIGPSSKSSKKSVAKSSKTMKQSASKSEKEVSADTNAADNSMDDGQHLITNEESPIRLCRTHDCLHNNNGKLKGLGKSGKAMMVHQSKTKKVSSVTIADTEKRSKASKKMEHTSTGSPTSSPLEEGVLLCRTHDCLHGKSGKSSSGKSGKGKKNDMSVMSKATKLFAKRHKGI